GMKLEHAQPEVCCHRNQVRVVGVDSVTAALRETSSSNTAQHS
ncbi:hypothetical protein CLV47_1181, partial [Antricoccus suffuscus]